MAAKAGSAPASFRLTGESITVMLPSNKLQNLDCGAVFTCFNKAPMRATTTINCDYCGKAVEREQRFVNRSIKLERKQFCSRQCCGKFYPGTINLEPLAANERDEFTQFRWFQKNLRKKSCKYPYDLSLQDIKNLWDSQAGICPITGWQLLLPHNAVDWKGSGDRHRRASLDRIDCTKGYMKGNVRFVALMANLARNTFCDDHLIEFAESVVRKSRMSDLHGASEFQTPSASVTLHSR